MKQNFAILLVVACMLLLQGCASLQETRTDAVESSSNITPEHTNSAGSDDEIMLVSIETGLTKEGCLYLFPSVVPSQCLEQWQKYTYAERVAYLHKHASPLIRTGIQVFRTQELQGQAANEDAEASQNETLNLSQIPYSETKVSECLRDESLHPDVCIFMYEDITTPEEMVDATIHLPRTHARAE